MFINSILFDSPIGSMTACASKRGISMLVFTDQHKQQSRIKHHNQNSSSGLQIKESPFLEQLKKELQEYFSGLRKQFTVPIDIAGTNFQESVWKSLLDIPYGETWSYKKQAIALDNPNAVRAVASANSHNRISIIIPCHRVIGSDGSLIGYAGGLHRKKWLLELEKNARLFIIKP